MNILITGIRGFIGFNAIMKWHDECPDDTFVGIDGNTYADKFMENVKNVWLSKYGIKQYVCDLSKNECVALLEDIISYYHIDAIVNYAAESHVDNSLKDPNVFFNSNVIGTANLLNMAKKHDLRFHQVSTDEVYGITYPEDNCREDFMLNPSSPYSSSKASADLIAMSYFKSFGTKVTISRCSNNFGPFQQNEKLLPTVICNAINDKNIPVYGNGLQRRHWISVDEHNDKIMWILKHGEIGHIYNIAPPAENYLSNLELIEFILSELHKPTDLIEHVTDRLGHDTSYFLYSDKCKSTKIWKEDLLKTIHWYQDNFSS